MRTVELTINGKQISAEVPDRITLADFLRTRLGLTGTHLGCEHGVCGACTISVDGEAVRSCLMLAVQADGSVIVTVEGLEAEDGRLSALQESFHKNYALQCGFCTPGMLMTIHSLLSAEPDANERRIREVISGNLCRCTGYEPIVQAALDARSAYE
ncbi:MAG: (2Fe-2S)-binding protein [Xanthobacteraceae bacterium]